LLSVLREDEHAALDRIVDKLVDAFRASAQREAAKSGD
jgi:hypothetical protein